MNQHGHKISSTPRTGTEAYIERIQHHPKHRIPKYGQSNRPLELTFDPGDFICNPPKVIARGFDQGLGGLIDNGSLAGEVEPDSR